MSAERAMEDGRKFREGRRGSIGASDAAAALGMAPPSWEISGPRDLVLDKQGKLEEKPATVAMKRGSLLEPLVLEEYERKSGRVCQLVPEQLHHAEYPWMHVNVDALSLLDSPQPDRLVEAKTSAYGAGYGEEGSDEIPDYYYIQTQHGLCVLNSLGYKIEVCDVPVLMMTSSVVQVFRVEADPAMWPDLIDAEREVWKHVEAGTLPPPTTSSEVAEHFRRSSPGKVEADAAVAAALADLRQLKSQLKFLDEKKGALEAKVKAFIGELDTLTVDGKVAATWKSTKDGVAVDTKRLLAEHPELAKQYEVEKPGHRRFLVKGV